MALEINLNEKRKEKEKNLPVVGGLEACRAGLPVLLALMGRRSPARFLPFSLAPA
jgi:hypothetical protein